LPEDEDDEREARLEERLDALAGDAWSAAWRGAVQSYRLLIATETDPIRKIGRERRLALTFLKRSKLRNNRHACRFARALAEDALTLARATGDRAACVEARDTLGNIFHHLGDRFADATALARAERLFLDALGDIDRHASKEAFASVTHNLAGLYATRHRQDGAVAHFNAAMALYRDARRAAARSRKPIPWAVAASNIGRMERDAAASLAGLRRAATRLRRALCVLERAGDTEQAAQTRHTLAVALTMAADIVYDKQDLEEAKRLWSVNAPLWTRGGRAHDWARMQNSLAIADFTIGEKEANPKLLRRAIAEFGELIGAVAGEGQTNERSRLAPWSRDRAPETFVSAVLNMTGARRRLAALESDPSHLRSALIDLRQAREIFDAATARLSFAEIRHVEGGVEAELGAMTGDAGLCGQGEESQLQALRIFEEIDRPAYVKLALNNLGDSLLRASILDETGAALTRAQAYLARACAMDGPDAADGPALRTRRNLLSVRLALAGRRSALADVTAVRDDIQAMRARFGPVLDPWERISLDALDAEAAAVQAEQAHDPMAAENLASVLRTLLERPELPVATALESRIALGSTLARLGQRDGAIAAWRTAQDVLWEQLLRTDSNGARKDLIRLSTHRRRPGWRAAGLARGLSLGDELAIALLERGQEGDIAEAITALERGRAMARALMALPDRDGEFAEELARVRNELRAAIAERDAADQFAFQQAGLDVRAASAVAKRRDSAWGRAVEIERKFRDLLARNDLNRAPAPRLPQVADAAPAGGCVVVIAVGAAKSAAVTIRLGSAGAMRSDVLWLPELNRAWLDARLFGSASEAGSHGLNAAIDAVSKASAENGGGAALRDAVASLDDAIRAAAVALWPVLMGPLDGRLREIGLGAVADIAIMAPGALAALPLHAACRAVENGPPRTFLDDWTVRFTPDLRSFVSCSMSASRADAEPRRILVVNDPCENLPGGATANPGELRDEKTRLVVLNGRAATVDRVLLELRDSAIFAFRGHGVYETADLQSSGLELAHSSRVTPRGAPKPRRLTIAMLKGVPAAPRRLCVLAACETAASDVLDAGDEFAGLTAEFLEAGYAAVIGASWPVDNAATDDLMRRFWMEFMAATDARTRTPAAALRRAQISMRDSRRTDARSIRLQRVESSAAPRRLQSSNNAPGDRAELDHFWWAGFRVVGM